MRNPSTPRSNQKRSTSSNSRCTSGLSQLRSGCSGANRWRYHCPSGTCVHAGPPKIDDQSFGSSRNQNRSLAPRSVSASWNQALAVELWFGTTSMITLISCSCASAMNASASARVPNTGSMPR
ncbi:MAG: hypothetical protein K0R62_7140 [Nonomuraea muscovyensis]|nr:hypothetical protein [Nonomuraea muscovyensis]